MKEVTLLALKITKNTISKSVCKGRYKEENSRDREVHKDVGEMSRICMSEDDEAKKILKILCIPS